MSQSLSPSLEALTSLGALQKGTFHYKQLLLAGFLHANFLHIILNSWALSSVGPFIEKEKGSIGMLIIFLIGILGGSLLSIAFQTNPFTISVGASSGIMALFTALFVISIKKRRTLLARRLIFTIVLSLVPLIPNVDYSGHLGGAIVGLLLGILL